MRLIASNKKIIKGDFLKYIIVFMLGIVFAACENPIGVNVNLNEEFNLKVGEQAVIKGEDLRIKFISVPEDTRCPLDLRCFWSGNAKVALTIRKDSNAPIEDSLNTHVDPRESEYLNYQITLKNLEPYPVQDESIPQTDYVATFIIKNNWNK